ncbi:hypothetical protein PR003_g35000, partial [Phytophthora rubi]
MPRPIGTRTRLRFASWTASPSGALLCGSWVCTSGPQCPGSSETCNPYVTTRPSSLQNPTIVGGPWRSRQFRKSGTGST